ncbi:MAG: YitT family protein [Bacilli bacterium]|nr:YitT family protein [Bacilli bacterium]
MNILKKEKIKNFLYILAGTALVAFSYSFFLSPNKLVIGGVSGIGVIFHAKEWFNDSLIMLIINGALLIVSLFLIGKEFFMKTIFASLAYPVFTFIFGKAYELLTEVNEIFDFSKLDLMLVTIFSSIIMGVGLAICMKYGASTGGTDTIQRLFYDKFKIPYSVTLYMVDGTIIAAGFFIIGDNLDILFYEIIFCVVCGVLMDAIIFSGFNKRSVHIISDKCEEIKDVLIHKFERGVTGISVYGEYSKTDKKMLVCVLSSNEYNKLRAIIEEIDPKAFFYCMRASEVRGEGFSYESEQNKLN